MDLNSDFSARAAVHAAGLDWVPSPMPGVDRRMLDRIGDEVARATSIVRYAPHSHFSPHTHDGGEEFLVLDGVFQDEHGDYPAGTYVRNPPSSRHTPGSEPGCTLFVKLWQFDPGDRTEVRLDTRGLPFAPAADLAGVELAPLFENMSERVRLERWQPGATIDMPVRGGIELLVLEGGFCEAGEEFTTHSWLRLPVGSGLRAQAGMGGCKLWVKSEHLPEICDFPGRRGGELSRDIPNSSINIH
jgi:quercetin dioxygenase-like cupin family protein